MLAAVRSASVLGIEAYDVCVEVDAARGLPNWFIVGLPAGEVKESRERVSAALTNAGFEIPPRRITISLSPGDLRKTGTGFDLPIAIGLLIALGLLDADAVNGLVALGELGLDGSIRGVRGERGNSEAHGHRGGENESGQFAGHGTSSKQRGGPVPLWLRNRGRPTGGVISHGG